MGTVDEVRDTAGVLDYYADPRTKGWFLVDNIWHLYTLLGVYIVFCIHVGPRLMRDRPPFELKTFLIIYNAFNVAVSLYITHEGLYSGWGGEYSFTCQPLDRSDSPLAQRMANGVWLYYMVKLFELTDTILFVLRKKTAQISFLHMMHHTMMPLAGFLGSRYFPGGHATLIGVLNSMVHVVMYSYYLIAALGPAYRKYLWWKKYITIMQMTQFGIIFVHMGQLFFRDGDSCFPKPLALLTCVWASIFFRMFFKFYVTAYVRPKRVTAQSATDRVSRGQMTSSTTSSDRSE